MFLHEIYFVNLSPLCYVFLILFTMLPSLTARGTWAYVTCLGFSSASLLWALRAGPADLPGLSSKPVSVFITKSRDSPTEKTCWWRNFVCVVFCINFNLLLTLQTKPNQTKPQNSNNKKLTIFLAVIFLLPSILFSICISLL